MLVISKHENHFQMPPWGKDPPDVMAAWHGFTMSVDHVKIRGKSRGFWNMALDVFSLSTLTQPPTRLCRCLR